MRSESFLRTLLDRLPPETVVVSPLGRTSEVLYRLRPDATLFTDTMGDVTALAIGLAIGARAVPILGVDTDGSFLMNLSVLMTCGTQLPDLTNLTLAVMDNELYESGGGRPSRVAPLDWSLLFAAVGLRAHVIRTVAEIPEGPPAAGTVLVARVSNDEAVAAADKPVDGVESSYLVEKLLAERQHRPRRRPARKP
jgi:thiamine pyrophosphate-dependent acetolactate synthase large subunit-like protein